MSTALTAAEQTQVLQAHNQARQAVGSPPLTWSDQLASGSQQWSDGCRWAHSIADDSNATYGENIAYSTPDITVSASGQQQPGTITGQQSIANGLAGWLNEQSSYNCGAAIPGCKAGQVCGHYTQMISNLSTTVGCGRTLCPTLANAGLPANTPADFFVCRYSPPGNVQGSMIMNPTACSAATSLPSAPVTTSSTTPITPTPAAPAAPSTSPSIPAAIPASPTTPTTPTSPLPTPSPTPTPTSTPNTGGNSVNWIIACGAIILVLGLLIMGILAARKVSASGKATGKVGASAALAPRLRLGGT